MDRDPVHRQTAAWAIKHLALGLQVRQSVGGPVLPGGGRTRSLSVCPRLQGLGCEDALQHLLNHVWPNIYETSPHVTQSVFEAVEALRVSLGPQRIFAYLLQGLFHPARRVREVHWKVYNNAMVYSADALTPVYPRLPPDTAGGPNPYVHGYLELLL